MSRTGFRKKAGLRAEDQRDAAMLNLFSFAGRPNPAATAATASLSPRPTPTFERHTLLLVPIHRPHSRQVHTSLPSHRFGSLHSSLFTTTITDDAERLSIVHAVGPTLDELARDHRIVHFRVGRDPQPDDYLRIIDAFLDRFAGDEVFTSVRPGADVIGIIQDLVQDWVSSLAPAAPTGATLQPPGTSTATTAPQPLIVACLPPRAPSFCQA